MYIALSSTLFLFKARKVYILIAVVCVSSTDGISFNGRRVSSDEAVLRDIMEMAVSFEATIRIHPRSESLFKNFLGEEYENCVAASKGYRSMLKRGYSPIVCSEDYLVNAGVAFRDICFIEEGDLQRFKDKIPMVVKYDFCRSYPSDVQFDLPLRRYKAGEEKVFEGKSHEEIRRRAYVR